MAKFMITGDTETGELTASLDGTTMPNVSYISLCTYEMEDMTSMGEDQKKCAICMESREKVGDATKVTTLYASKDSKKELADAVILSTTSLSAEKMTQDFKQRVGDAILDQMKIKFGK